MCSITNTAHATQKTDGTSGKIPPVGQSAYVISVGTMPAFFFPLPSGQEEGREYMRKRSKGLAGRRVQTLISEKILTLIAARLVRVAVR